MPRVLMAGEKESKWTTVSQGNRAIEIGLHGAVSKPVIYINGTPIAFDVSLKAGDMTDLPRSAELEGYQQQTGDHFSRLPCKHNPFIDFRLKQNTV